jgi:hypothetical protein
MFVELMSLLAERIVLKKEKSSLSSRLECALDGIWEPEIFGVSPARIAGGSGKRIGSWASRALDHSDVRCLCPGVCLTPRRKA